MYYSAVSKLHFVAVNPCLVCLYCKWWVVLRVLKVSPNDVLIYMDDRLHRCSPIIKARSVG